MDLLKLTAVELGRKIGAGEVRVAEAAEAVLKSIEQKEPLYHCYITVDQEGVMERARLLQQRIDRGELTGDLAGVPVAVKDNICTEGMLTTCGSRMLGNFVPTYSAEAVRRLEKAGMLIIGKANLDEFAMGSTTETSAYGPTRNPWDVSRVPGGSSGGSAAAVAAGECFCALGSDTGGSIRQPAAFCGLVGLKPSYGLVSRYGLVAYASSLDQIGPIARNVEDCAALLGAIAGHDTKDATSVDIGEQDWMGALAGDVQGLRIGVLGDYLGEGIAPEVKEAVLKAAGVLEGMGAVAEEFALGLVEYAVPAYYTIASAEASSNLGRFDGVKYGYRTQEYGGLHQMYKKSRSEGFGEEVKRRIMLGSFVLSAGYYDAYYLKAMKVRAMVKKSFDAAFEKYDIILGPVAPTTAPRLGESLSDPIRMYLGDIYTVGANLAGLPAISLPCGRDQEGMPIGLQMMGNCFQEKVLLRAAYAYEKASTTNN